MVIREVKQKGKSEHRRDNKAENMSCDASKCRVMDIVTYSNTLKFSLTKQNVWNDNPLFAAEEPSQSS